MHAYCFVRGQLDFLNRYLNNLMAVNLDYHYPINANGQIILNGKFQLGVRPVQLVEFAFPEECRNEALKWIWPSNISNGKLNELALWPLKKMLGCTEDINLEGLQPYWMGRDFVDVTPIGLRKDKYMHIIKHPDGRIEHIRLDDMFMEKEGEDGAGNKIKVQSRGAEDI